MIWQNYIYFVHENKIRVTHLCGVIRIPQTIIIHGGAGYWREDRLMKALNFLKDLGEKSYKVLLEKGSLAAVEYAINKMEESPLFNAGRGGAPNLLGHVELDAGLMKSNGEAGFVASVKNVIYAISLAKIVMTETDHLMIVGEGAESLAKIKGLWVPENELLTNRTINLWRESVSGLLQVVSGQLSKERLAEDSILRRILDYYPHLVEFLRKNRAYLEKLQMKLGTGDTVGAVAFDGDELVAGTSTGGLFLKLPGRVGDTPLPGAGTFANEKGACSATGVGEDIIRVMLAKSAVDLTRNLSARDASREVFRILGEKFKIRAGIILIDQEGDWGIYHKTPKFPCVVVENGSLIIKDEWRE